MKEGSCLPLPAVKPKHLTEYYAALEAYEKQGVTPRGSAAVCVVRVSLETVENRAGVAGGEWGVRTDIRSLMISLILC